jgi:DHA2 family multidrug resistance protein
MFVGCLQYVLEKGQEKDWFNDSTITVLTVLSVLGCFFFIWRQSTYRNPIVNLKVLSNGNLRIGTIMSFILGFGLYGSTFIIPLYTQSILGWTATQAGLLFVPAALTTAVMMPFIGQMLQRGVKQQYLVSLGLLTFFFFCFWGHNILTPDTPKSTFFWPLILRGVAMGMLFIPITTLSLSTLKGRQIGEGAAFTGMMRQLGGSFGVAIISTFMARKTMVHRSDLVSKLDVTNPEVQNRLLAMQHSFSAQGQDPNSALKALDFTVMKQASVLSYMDVFLFIGVLFLVCIPFVLLVRGRSNKQPKVEMH